MSDEEPVFTAQKFVFDAPLYENLTVEDEKDLLSICAPERSRVDGLCLFCKNDSIFHPNDNISTHMPTLRSRILGSNIFRFTCVRCSIQEIIICAIVIAKRNRDLCVPLSNISIRKIGQWSTYADLANKELNQYYKILSEMDRKELGTANGIAAHGVNIGAYVYLRRVFERLIQRAFDDHGGSMPKEEFLKLHMPDKIDVTKEILPDFVKNNKNIYNILSKGIHELDEDTCAAYFEVIKESIMIMLDHERELSRKIEKEKKIAEAIKKIEL